MRSESMPNHRGRTPRHKKSVRFDDDADGSNLTRQSNKRSRDDFERVATAEVDPHDASTILTTESDLVRADLQSKKKARETLPTPKGAIVWEKIDTDRDEILPGDPIAMIDPRLPKPPFRWGMFAAMGGGKTSLISSLLQNGPGDPSSDKPGFKGVFDEVHIFSPNLLKDAAWKWLRNSGFPRSRMHTTFSRVDLENKQRLWDRERLEQMQKDGVPFGSAKRVLIVFDDFINLKPDRPMSGSDDSIVDSRHGGTSFIISGQRYNKANTITRNNLSHISFWPAGSKNDQDLIIQDQGLTEGFTVGELRKHFERVQEFPKPMDMIFIDKTKCPAEQMSHGIGGPLLSEGTVVSFDEVVN